MTLDGTYVTICDWHGRVTWISGSTALSQVGDIAWENLADDFQDLQFAQSGETQA